MTTTYPDLAVVRDYLRVPATALADDDLQRMMDAAEGDQRARCVWPEVVPEPVEGGLPPALEQAFLRRVQREVAARNLPLGMVGLDAAEYGPQSLPFLDALVEEHERAFRRVVLA